MIVGRLPLAGTVNVLGAPAVVAIVTGITIATVGMTAIVSGIATGSGTGMTGTRIGMIGGAVAGRRSGGGARALKDARMTGRGRLRRLRKERRRKRIVSASATGRRPRLATSECLIPLFLPLSCARNGYCFSRRCCISLNEIIVLLLVLSPHVIRTVILV